MEFVREDVAAKYNMVPESDRTVTMPGMYHGPLSGITMECADKMYADLDNQLTLKDGTSSAAGESRNFDVPS